jgi:hypothetical protein
MQERFPAPIYPFGAESDISMILLIHTEFTENTEVLAMMETEAFDEMIVEYNNPNPIDENFINIAI